MKKYSHSENALQTREQLFMRQSSSEQHGQVPQVFAGTEASHKKCVGYFEQPFWIQLRWL